VGWATIEAVVVAVILGWPALRGKIAGARAELPDMRIAEREFVARGLSDPAFMFLPCLGRSKAGEGAIRSERIIEIASRIC
jgi:hypothetical protein